MGTISEFQSLAEVRQHRIFTFAYYWLGNREDAEDITQVVLTKWWRHGDSVESASLDAWLAAVTRNACFDLTRRRRPRRQAELPQEASVVAVECPDPRPCPRTVAASGDSMSVMGTAIAELPEIQRSIVILREVQGLSYEEVAGTLQVPLHQVKTYLHRARRRLREILRERVSRGEL